MITWWPLDIDLETIDFEILTQDLLKTPKHCWYHCNYRNSDILPVLTESGTLKLSEMNKEHELKWTEGANFNSTLKEVLQKTFLPLFDPTPRVMVIRTEPGQITPAHYDCDQSELEKDNYKVRMVLQGKVDSLYFLNSQGEKVYIPSGERLYLMDGSHPHGMDNGDSVKLTLAFGSPWKSFSQGVLSNIMDQSLKARKGLLRSSIGRPDVPELFQRPSPAYFTYEKEE